MSAYIYGLIMKILSDSLKAAETADEERARWEAIASLAAAYPALHRKAVDEERMGEDSPFMRQVC